MTDKERAWEFIECAVIVAVNESGKRNGKTNQEIQNAMNNIFAEFQKFDSNFNTKHGNNLSAYSTDWESYKENSKEWINLATRISLL